MIKYVNVQTAQIWNPLQEWGRDWESDIGTWETVSISIVQVDHGVCIPKARDPKLEKV